jgi:hypothetical protein
MTDTNSDLIRHTTAENVKLRAVIAAFAQRQINLQRQIFRLLIVLTAGVLLTIALLIGLEIYVWTPTATTPALLHLDLPVTHPSPVPHPSLPGDPMTIHYVI